MGIETHPEQGGAPPPQVVDTAGGQALGDAELFGALYPSLLRFARVVSPIEVDPCDLVQDALTNVLRSGGLSRLDHPEAYLRRIIVNLAANHRRSLGRARRAAQRRVPDAVSQLDQYPSDVGALLALDPLDRAIVFLADVERRSFADIAEVLDMTESTARGRASRARGQLRRQFEETES